MIGLTNDSIAAEQKQNGNEITRSILEKAAKRLHSIVWTPLTLESAIRITCELSEFKNHSDALVKLFDTYFGKLLI